MNNRYKPSIPPTAERRTFFYWLAIPLILLLVFIAHFFVLDQLSVFNFSGLLSAKTESLGEEPCDHIKILKRCNELILSEKSRACLQLSEQFFQRCGDYDQLHQYINAAARKISEWPVAITSANKLIELYPINADMHWMRGNTYEEKGDIGLALPDYEQALALMPSGIQPPFHLANIYQRLGRPCDGIAPLEQFVFYHPNNAEAASHQLQALYQTPQCATFHGVGSAKIQFRRGSASIRSHAVVNNQKGSFIIDTGATTVVLSRAFADRAGINYRQWPIRYMQTANGITRGYYGYLDEVSLQGLQAKRIESVVADQLGGLDGLLGLSFLGRFDMHMNSREGFIKLTQKKS